MHFVCNGREVGEVEHVEWKSPDSPETNGTVTFLAPFEFEWQDKQNAYLVLDDSSSGSRYLLPEITRIDEGGTGTFVVARYKEMAG